MEAQASLPWATEIVAQTEKKMHMTLDEIIKMSKNKDYKSKRPRVPNKNKNQRNSNVARQDKTASVRQYMNSRSSLRQGALSQRRSNYHGNQFPFANEAARRAVTTPYHGMAPRRDRMVNQNRSRNGFPMARTRPQRNAESKKPEARDNGNSAAPKTLDALFANLKEQRMKAAFSSTPKVVAPRQRQRHNNNGGGGSRKQIPPWARKLVL